MLIKTDFSWERRNRSSKSFRGQHPCGRGSGDPVSPRASPGAVPAAIGRQLNITGARDHMTSSRIRTRKSQCSALSLKHGPTLSHFSCYLTLNLFADCFTLSTLTLSRSTTGSRLGQITSKPVAHLESAQSQPTQSLSHLSVCI